MLFCLIKKILTSNLFSSLLTAVIALFGFYYVQKETRINDARKLLREEKRRVYLDFSTKCNVRSSFDLYMKTLADLTQKNVATPDVRKRSAETEVHFQLDLVLNQISLIGSSDIFMRLKDSIESYEKSLLEYCIFALQTYTRNPEGKVTGATHEKQSADLLSKSNHNFDTVISIMRTDLYNF